MSEELLCVGCGIKLQCEDENKEGYVHPNAFSRSFILCKRCYQLKHYGKFTVSNEVKNTIDKLHSSANKNDLVILICDVGLVYTPLIKQLKELNSFSNVIMVCNRYDLYKDFIKIEKAYNFIYKEIKNSKINIKKVFIIDNNIDEIFDYIDNNSIDNNAYLVGLENAGKTTFVNEILRKIANEDTNFLTNSKYPGTTVDLIKIQLDDNHYLIDSPGIHSKGNLLNYVEKDFIKYLSQDNKLRSVGFQLNANQSLLVSNIIKFDNLDNGRGSVVFYGSSMLDISRCKLEKSESTFINRMADLKLKTNKVKSINDLYKHSFKITGDDKFDIVVEGIGFFSVRKGNYNVYTFKNVNVFLRKSMI